MQFSHYLINLFVIFARAILLLQPFLIVTVFLLGLIGFTLFVYAPSAEVAFSVRLDAVGRGEPIVCTPIPGQTWLAIRFFIIIWAVMI